MKILEICVELLFYPFLTKYLRLDEISDKILLRRIFELCYRLFKHTIREYRPNELYGS